MGENDANYPSKKTWYSRDRTPTDPLHFSSLLFSFFSKIALSFSFPITFCLPQVQVLEVVTVSHGTHLVKNHESQSRNS